MTKHVDSVARLRAYEEPNGSFAVDGTGTLGNFLDVPFIESSWKKTLDEPLETPAHVQQHIDTLPVLVHMPKRGRASFDINLAGLGLATGARTQGALGRLLKIALGGEFLGTSTTVNDAAATTSSFTLASAANFPVGGAIAVATGTGGRLEMREIKSKSSNTITLKHALTNAPANSSVVYAAATYYLGSRTELGDANTGTTLQLIYEGLETDDRWYFSGGQIASPPTLTLSNGTIARISFDWQFAQWFKADGTNQSANLTSSELATATYSNYRPVVIKDSELRVTTVGTSSIANTLIDAPSYEVKLNLAYWAHMAPGGANNIIGYVRQRTAPVVEGSFTYPYEDSTWHTAKANDTRRAVFLQMGSSPTATTGGGVLLSVPNIQISDVQRTPIDGISGQAVSWKASTDADTSGSTASLAYSAIRIHLF